MSLVLLNELTLAKGYLTPEKDHINLEKSLPSLAISHLILVTSQLAVGLPSPEMDYLNPAMAIPESGKRSPEAFNRSLETANGTLEDGYKSPESDN